MDNTNETIIQLITILPATNKQGRTIRLLTPVGRINIREYYEDSKIRDYLPNPDFLAIAGKKPKIGDKVYYSMQSFANDEDFCIITGEQTTESKQRLYLRFEGFPCDNNADIWNTLADIKTTSTAKKK